MHTITNNHNLPLPVVDAIRRQHADTGPRALVNAMLTAELAGNVVGHTTLMKPPQHVQFGLDHDTTEDAQDAYYALFGQMLHTVLEAAPPKQHMTEVVFAMPWQFDDFISAGLDLAELNDAGDITAITDYKTTSVWEWIYGMREERVLQLNLQRYIATHASVMARHDWPSVNRQPPRVAPDVQLGITYFFRDWRQAEAARKPDYPQHPVIHVPVEVWDWEKIGETIRTLMNDRQAALEKQARPCTDDERWKKPEQYRVFSKTKDGKKWKERADRVTDSAEQAFDWLRWKGWIEGNELPDNIRIEATPVEYNRCQPRSNGSPAYCPFAAVCPQNQETP